MTFVPLEAVQTIIPLVNRHSHDIAQTHNDEFWKYLCEHKYYFQDGTKPIKQCWKDFSTNLGMRERLREVHLLTNPKAKGFAWEEESLPPNLVLKNRGYSVESDTDIQLVRAMANRPLTPEEKYFEVFIDNIVGDGSEPAVCVGIVSGENPEEST